MRIEYDYRLSYLYRVSSRILPPNTANSPIIKNRTIVTVFRNSNGLRIIKHDPTNKYIIPKSFISQIYTSLF